MDLSDYELMIYAMIGVAWLLYSAIIGIGPALLLRWKVHPEPYTKGMAVGIQVVLEILKMLYRLVLADYLDMEPTNPDYSSRKHKMSKRARHVESDQRVTGYPQKTDGIRPG